ncbi:MAG: LytTR family DNA-binding domain-containing protein [Oscillospiraceae bacterium]|jgi:DNA-binding LytR/AlgR family response regulator|nr:LytTR family DNA-binding domain-containing protein [Oscillospiraceae bacterium]
MLKIAICDDEKAFSSQIEKYLIKLSKLLNHKIETEVFNSGKEFRSHVEGGATFDVIYMDIEMDEMNGVEAGKWLREVYKDETTLLIYVSSHEGYYRELFDVQPYNFIKKPIDKAEFKRIFMKVCEKIAKSNDFFEFIDNRVNIKLRLSEIMYFESANRVINIYTSDKTYKTYMKLDDVSEKITHGNFIRIHKSLLVNIDYAETVFPHEVVLRNGVKLSVSEQYQKSVNSQYKAHLKGGG